MPHELCKVFASLPLVERGVSKVLGGDPKGINFLYTNQKSVIIRNIDNPEIADIYTEHAHHVQVAQYAPSGYYIASGDVSGKIRIWDTTQKEHLLKYEYQPFAGTIKDICWSGDSQKVAIVGQGKQIYGAVFQWDTGTSVGLLTGHSKIVNSIAFKPNRPFRVVTGSDDFSCVFFEGLPLKFRFTIKNHSSFVNCVRYSPDGTKFASAGTDGQIFIYDGKDGSQICALGGDRAHSGGVYAVSWSPESSTHLLSASGDKTVKLWDIEANSAVTTFNMGSDGLDQQLGCLWQKNHLLSVSLSGYINYLDKANPSKPLRVLKGHSKSIQSLTVRTCDGKHAIYSGSHDGHINDWNAQTGESDTFAGKGHTNQVSCMVVNDSNELVTCGMDDDVRFTNMIKKEYNAEDRVKMDAQPTSVAVGPGGYTVVICIGQIVLLKDKKKVFMIENLNYDPRCAAIHPGGGTVAVGGNDSIVHLYSIQGNTLQKDCVITSESLEAVLTMAYSPDGANLAVCSEKVITVFGVADGYKDGSAYYGHHAKALCISWSPDNQHFATGGMDGLIFIWTLNDKNKMFKIPDAHRLHHVNCIAWLDEHTLVSSSPDACVKQWTITYN